MIVSALTEMTMLVVAFVLSMQVLGGWEETSEMLRSAWIDEYDARGCAEWEAASGNVQDAANVLAEMYPDFSAQIEEARGELHTAVDVQLATCVGQSFQSCFEPYRQVNPRFGRNWPNWRVRACEGEPSWDMRR